MSASLLNLEGKEEKVSSEPGGKGVRILNARAQ